jgi:hypothetical protein
VWEILNFEEFLSLKVQLNYKKWFVKEKEIGKPVHTWANGTSYTSFIF